MATVVTDTNFIGMTDEEFLTAEDSSGTWVYTPTTAGGGGIVLSYNLSWPLLNNLSTSLNSLHLSDV